MDGCRPERIHEERGDHTFAPRNSLGKVPLSPDAMNPARSIKDAASDRRIARPDSRRASSAPRIRARKWTAAFAYPGLLTRLAVILLGLMPAGYVLAPTHAPTHAGAMLWSDQPGMEAPLVADTVDVTRLATAIFHATNEVRRQIALKPFERIAGLDQAADLQANANALNVAASHHNIVAAWATTADRVKRQGLNPGMVSENVAVIPLVDVDLARGYFEKRVDGKRVVVDGVSGEVARPHTYASFARAIVRAWMGSPGHRANIVNPHYHYLGCSARPTQSIAGIVLGAGVQVFFTPATDVQR